MNLQFFSCQLEAAIDTIISQSKNQHDLLETIPAKLTVFACFSSRALTWLLSAKVGSPTAWTDIITVWAGIRTHMHFIEGHFDAQRHVITGSQGPLLYQSSTQHAHSADIWPNEHRFFFPFFTSCESINFTEEWANVPQTTKINLINYVLKPLICGANISVFKVLFSR